MSTTISSSDLLAKRNPYCRFKFICYPFRFSFLQCLLGRLMGRWLQPYKNLSVRRLIKIEFTFPRCIYETFSFDPIFAMVQTIIRSGLSHSWKAIPTLPPFQRNPKTQKILFQSCGGTRLALIFFP